MNRLVRGFTVLIAGISATSFGLRKGEAQPASATSRPARVTVPEEPDALRREVMENLLNLPAGPGRVADFNLPREFLGRVADRILTAAFEEQFRMVVADGPASQPTTRQTTSRPTSRSAGEAGVRVVQTIVTPERAAIWRSWREDYPAQRGFRVPLALAVANGQARPQDADKIAIPFRPTIPGWRMCSESGESEIDGLHLQLSRGDDWLAPGDGGCMDVGSQLAAVLPTARIVASIEQKHLANFLNEAADWKPRRTGETWALVSPMPVAQWAQDNCKFGWVETNKPAARTRVALVPRYPSRGEAGAVFVPSEAVVLQGLAECGVASVVQSPLLFQAGNLFCAWDAGKKQRVLLIGEAEIYRNVALGLTRAHVEEALRIEFGVDKCVVLPAASFHIDYEISVRNVDGRTIALVNDEQAAAKLVLQCGVDALVRAGEFKDEDALKTKRLIEADDFKALEPLGPIFERAGPSPGQIGLSFAEKFGRGQVDSGVGNLLCFLKAMDLWVLTRMPHVDFTEDPNGVAMNASFQAMRRHEADRLALQTVIKSLGWEVVAIPSMGDSKRALNYLNGIHDKSRFFMPAYGGTFEKVDQAAQAAVRKAFGPSVEIVPIRCAESQRREGAVRCSAAVMYAAPQR